MRIAAIYDIHANLPALEAVLAEIGRADIDQIVVGGDVFPGPMPRESLDRLMSLEPAVRIIRGNGDREVLARLQGVETSWYRAAPLHTREPIDYCARQLGTDDLDFLASWQPAHRESVSGIGQVLFCHATPLNDTDVFFRTTPDADIAPWFAGIEAQLVVCGHTHMQFDRTIGGLRVINAGSVGMPFGNTGAFWLLIDGCEIQFHQTHYDLTKAADQIRATQYPGADEFAETYVLNPPTEAAVFARWNQAPR